MTNEDGGKRASIRLCRTDPPVLIHEDVYGHFAEHLGRCVYGGLWVGETSSIGNTRGIVIVPAKSVLVLEARPEEPD